MAVPFQTPKTEKEWKKFRNQVQKLVNRANALLDKLERENLENTPSYHTFTTSEGRSRFGIKGLTNEEVNAEYQRVKAFLDNSTSTIKGAKNYLRNMAHITGLSYGEVQTSLPDFWAIADEVRKSLNAAKMNYLALDSERVIEAVRGVIQSRESDSRSIGNLGDALERALDELENNLPNAFEEDTIEYLNDYIEKNIDLKDIEINLNLW